MPITTRTRLISCLSASLVALSLSVASCSRHAQNRADTTMKLYDLGRTDASDMLRQCTTEAALRVRLLQVRSRISNIKTHAGNDAAMQYESGFRQALTEQSDSLAQILF